MSGHPRLAAALFLASFALLLYELLLVRIFAVVLFADFAHLALALALLGIAAGAMLQHLRPSLVPEDAVERRLGWIALAQAALTVAAVVAIIRWPIVRGWETPPETYQDRSHVEDDLLDPVWFAAVLPVLAAPFSCAGLFFAAAFARRKDDIPWMYAADLLGAAAAALLFVPLLTTLAGPDAAWVAVAGATAAGTLLLWRSPWRWAAFVATLAAVGLAVAGTRAEILRIREAAGYSDTNVVYTRWTPLTRLAIHRDQRGDYMLLDNASASEIFLTEARRAELMREANRGLVYAITDPPARVAILAASAGPEVGVAQGYGFRDVTAIDIAGEIFDIVAERYPDSPVNPYVVGNTRRVNADGRAAIMQASEPFDVIQMVHANLWSSAGLLSNAWSPSLLETTDAFGAYLDHLSPDGTLSFGRGSQSDDIVRAAVAALRARGVADPWRNLVDIGGSARVILVKHRPWTEEELARIDARLPDMRNAKFTIDPRTDRAERAVAKIVAARSPLTDAHPYSDTPRVFLHTLQTAGALVGGEDSALSVLYRSIVVQCGFALLGGVLFLALPWLRRGRGEASGLSGVGAPIVYVAGLGYGYLALETVLIHELVLFVGHPTYAVTVVVLALLVGSGLGSMWSGTLAPTAARTRTLLAGTIGLGLAVAVLLPRVLEGVGLAWPLAVRVGATLVALLPLGFVMGTAFPLGTRLLPAAAARLLPWMWAINGWMSVVGSLLTVLLARLYGYPVAFTAALLAYGVSWVAARHVARVSVT